MFRNVYEIEQAKKDEATDALEGHKKTLFGIVRAYIRSRWPRYLVWLPVLLICEFENYRAKRSLHWYTFTFRFSLEFVQDEHGEWNIIEVDDRYPWSNVEELQILKDSLERTLPFTIVVERFGEEI